MIPASQELTLIYIVGNTLICDQVESKESAMPLWKVLGIYLEKLEDCFCACKVVS